MIFILADTAGLHQIRLSESIFTSLTVLLIVFKIYLRLIIQNILNRVNSLLYNVTSPLTIIIHTITRILIISGVCSKKSTLEGRQ